MLGCSALSKLLFSLIYELLILTTLSFCSLHLQPTATTYYFINATVSQQSELASSMQRPYRVCTCSLMWPQTGSMKMAMRRTKKQIPANILYKSTTSTYLQQIMLTAELKKSCWQCKRGKAEAKAKARTKQNTIKS